MNPDPVNHPLHYGGENNLYETVKVMQARLTPQEFVGACKFNVYKYNDRAPGKAALVDHLKASWYQQRMVDYIETVGFETIYPPPLYWGEAGEPEPDPGEIIATADILTVITIHSNLEPHTIWYVRFPISEDGDTDCHGFESREAAETFVEGFRPEADRPHASPCEPPMHEDTIALRELRQVLGEILETIPAVKAWQVETGNALTLDRHEATYWLHHEFNRLRTRETDLLDANNRYQARYRQAERQLADHLGKEGAAHGNAR